MTRSTPATSPARRRTVLRAALLASAALGVGLLSACGSGQITGTDDQVAAVPGINMDSADGQIALRDAVVAYADVYKPGSTVPINVRLFNNSKQAVKLTGVTSGNGRIVLVGEAKASAAAAAPPPSPSSVAPSSASPSVSSTKKPSGSASAPKSSGSASAPAVESPAAAPAPTSAGASDISVAIPVNGFASLSRDGGSYLAVDSLTGAPLLAGGALKNVVFTFTYADGKTTTITLPDLPMTPPLTPLPKPSSVVSGEGE